MTALVIEDNEVERDYVIQYLAKLGEVDCETCATLSDAMAELGGRSFDLVILDLQLEDSTAENTITRLPEIRLAAGTTPIVICTGNPSAILEGTMIYAQGIVRKPYTSDYFLDVVKTAINSTKLREPFADLKKKP